MFDLVIKIGGSLLVQDENLRRFSKDITSVQKNYPHFKILIVHGGGPYIKEELDRAKIKFEFVDGQRVTSKEMMPHLHNALWKRANQKISKFLENEGLGPKRLCGFEHKILNGKRLSSSLGEVGEVESLNLKNFQASSSSLCILCPVGTSDDGLPLNINADYAAMGVSRELGAKNLIFLSDQIGVLDHRKELIKDLTEESFKELSKKEVIVGGMFVKCLSIFKALKNGVDNISLLDGRRENTLTEFIQGRVRGTRFTI